MTSRERVMAVISGEKADRIPIYGWVAANLTGPIEQRFGSVRDFEDRYEFDYAHLFGGPPTFDESDLETLRSALNGPIRPQDLLDVSLHDPNESASYDGIEEQIEHHKRNRERFVYVQTPGIFEALNGPFGIENHLFYLAMCPDILRRVYERQAEWNRAFAHNCLDLGVDMIHVSDDWGAQNGLLFSPEIWKTHMFPCHKITADAVKSRGAFLSLHSDGNVRQVVDGIVELGYDVVHPWQESAGMSLDEYRTLYRKDFVIMGGLDVQTTLGFGRLDHLASEIERVMEMFKDGGLLLCTSHFVQEHCSMEELTFAFDLIKRKLRET